MRRLFLDSEAYSTVNLKVTGAAVYARHPDTELLLLSYRLPGEAAIKLWSPAEGEPAPGALLKALRDPSIQLVAHNAQFDRQTIAWCLWRLGYFTAKQRDELADARRWYCTMAKALSVGLPGSLELLGDALGLPQDQVKLKDGKRLIQRFCKPAPSNHKAERYDHRSHPEEWARFRLYAIQDTAAMIEIEARTPDWNYRGVERDLWQLDQKINDRGFRADAELVEAGIAAAAKEKQRLANRFRSLTRYCVNAPTQREQFRLYLNSEFGLSLDNTQANTFRGLIAAGGLDPRCVELMQISIMANKSSTAKYGALRPAICEDGRFRGALQFAGAARTRRWAGRIFQAHNLPSRGLPPNSTIEAYIDALKADMQDEIFGGDDQMLLGSAALRGLVLPGEGKKIVAADLSNIEGRFLAWLANEAWKLKAFADFDAGSGPDLYNVTAASIIGGDPWNMAKANRNVFGKVPELALGYAGGVGAFQTFAATYGVRMAEHWGVIQQNLDPTFIEAARRGWQKRGHLSDLPAEEWIPSEAVKLAWRARHPATSALWYACENAAIRAVENPNRRFNAGKHLAFFYRDDFLRMLLPSGRFVCFYKPWVERPESKDGRQRRPTLWFWGIDSDSKSPTFKAWVPQKTYGGHMVENACQAGSRDILADRLAPIEAASFDVILTVHDEVVTEAALEKTHEELSRLLATNPAWSQGLPLAAAGFCAERYRKD